MRALILAALILAAISPARAAPLDVPSDGTDGVLSVPGPGNAASSIDLSLAGEGAWDTPIPPAETGHGIYDPSVWAVVFKYQSVTVDGTLYFQPHPSGAPVVWLVDGDVTITGAVNLDAFGQIAGPGGFNGGTARIGSIAGSGGLGPGGGSNAVGGGISSGSYGAVGLGDAPGPAYGNAKVFPLIGGSGGSDGVEGNSGGGGGGAILVIAKGTVAISGSIHATGGLDPSARFESLSGGSGGGIRLVADKIQGSGGISSVSAYGTGGVGRIRLEANSISMPFPGLPSASAGPVDVPLKIFPDQLVPVIRSVKLGGHDLPADPPAFAPSLEIPDVGDYQLEIEAGQVPSNAAMVVRITPLRGPDSTVNATFLSGNLGSSQWRATVTLTDGVSDIQVRAVLP